MIRHCEEGHRPDVAIRSPVKRERIPTAPPGPRNDGVGTQGTPANGAPSRRAPQSCTTRCPPHHGRTTKGGASKRVARTALQLPPHSGNGRENGPMSEATPRRYSCARLSNQALLVNGGPGDGRLRAPLGARRSRPPAIFSPLLDRSKRGSPPGRRNPPQPNGAVQNRREGQAPPLRVPKVQMGRAGLGPAPTAAQGT